MSLGAGVRKFCLFVLVLGVFTPRAFAAFASCKAGWEWANNSMNQNPCQIAGALEASCQGFTVYELGPLNQSTNYLAPQLNSSSQKCECNTVMYSLYMACTGCQNVTIQSWHFWSQYCLTAGVYVGEYPQPIPSNTAVPHWAYLSYNANDTFNPQLAEAAGDGPESVALVPSTISASSGSTRAGSPSTVLANPTGTPTGTSTGQDSNTNTNKSSNSGAIAGGVVGGLALLAIIGVGVWIFLRRRAAARTSGGHLGYPKYSAVSPSPEHGTSPLQMRLYNPSDPTTYPSHGDYATTAVHTTNAGHSGGRYTGAAEL